MLFQIREIFAARRFWVLVPFLLFPLLLSIWLAREVQGAEDRPNIGRSDGEWQARRRKGARQDQDEQGQGREEFARDQGAGGYREGDQGLEAALLFFLPVKFLILCSEAIEWASHLSIVADESPVVACDS